MHRPDDIIRVGDIIEIVEPVQFVRCGYPLSLDEVRDRFQEYPPTSLFDGYVYKDDDKTVTKDVLEALKLLGFECIPHGRAHRKLVEALAYLYISEHGFGGRERKIYTKPLDEKWIGEKHRVVRIKIHKTGTYYGPGGGYDSWNGEYYYEPGGLDNMKTHKIIDIDAWDKSLRDGRGDCMSLPVSAVKKVIDGRDINAKDNPYVKDFTYIA